MGTCGLFSAMQTPQYVKGIAMPRVFLLAVILAVVCCGCGSDSDTDAPVAENLVAEKPVAEKPVAEKPVAENSVEQNAVGQDADSSEISTVEAALASVSATPGEYVRFPAVGVKIAQPDGFQVAEEFHGFAHTDSGCSILTLKIPGPFSEVTGGFTKERLGARGMVLHSKSEIEIEGFDGFLISLSQQAYGMNFKKWLVCFGDEESSTMVTATFPASAEKRIGAQLKKIVLAVKHDDGPPPPLGSDVGFTIATANKLKLTSDVGKTLLYTKDGVIPAKSPSDPFLVVARSIADVVAGDRRQYALNRLQQTADIKVTSIVSTEEVTVDSLDGFATVAEAVETDTDAPMIVYQVMLFDGRAYFLIQGRAGKELSDEFLGEFKEMARSFKRRVE